MSDRAFQKAAKRIAKKRTDPRDPLANLKGDSDAELEAAMVGADPGGRESIENQIMRQWRAAKIREAGKRE